MWMMIDRIRTRNKADTTKKNLNKVVIRRFTVSVVEWIPNNLQSTSSMLTAWLTWSHIITSHRRCNIMVYHVTSSITHVTWCDIVDVTSCQLMPDYQRRVMLDPLCHGMPRHYLYHIRSYHRCHVMSHSRCHIMSHSRSLTLRACSSMSRHVTFLISRHVI